MIITSVKMAKLQFLRETVGILELFIRLSGICFRRTSVDLYQPDKEEVNSVETA